MLGSFNTVYFVTLHIKWIIMLMEIYKIYFKKPRELKDFTFCNKELLGGFQTYHILKDFFI